MPRLRLGARPRLPFALLIALASGLLLSTAFPPVGWWPLAFIALAPLVWLLWGVRPRRGFLLGLVFGLAFYGATIYWIWRFGALAWTALTLLCALSVALFGLLTPALRRPGRPIVSALATAALWTVLDWARSAWPFGGFSWGGLGVSQVDNRVTVRLATVAGVWGVTFAVVAVNALVVTAITERGGGRGRTTALVALGSALALAVVPLAIPFGTADGDAIDVAAIQVDVREAAAAASSGADEDIRVAQLNIDQHRELVGDPPDLAIWGEGALDPAAASDPATVTAVQDVVAEVGAPTLIGAVLDDERGQQRTSVVLLGGDGDFAGRYDKVHLVPFGEYVPFRDRLQWIDAIDQVPIDRTPGERIETLTTGGLPAFGTPICFENSFPDIPRAMVNAGAGFLVVTVNNASYGFTAASDQHLQMTQIRAIEDGRWVINGAVSGISAFVDPAGRVSASEGLFHPAILRGTIRSSDERTWYVRLGDWLPWLLLAFLVVVFLIPRRRPTERKAPGPLDTNARTLVILPTYDERATIEQVLKGIRSAPQDVDILVVDDSSPDGTADAVREAMSSDPGIRLLERPQRSGLAGAYMEGFTVALREGYDLVVEMDSDLSHEPAELPSLLDAAAAGDDLVVGSRYIEGGSVSNWSRIRVALSRAGNLYARVMLGIPLHDATSGFRVYRAGLLTELVARPFTSDGYGFQIELVMRAWDLGYTLAEVPITFREREHGQSKISRRIIVEALWLVTTWGLRRRFRLSPSAGPSSPLPEG
ncbi:MAG TPA: apolipoprotein N-acyltransferase [Actinomycetota bacterium]